MSQLLRIVEFFRPISSENCNFSGVYLCKVEELHRLRIDPSTQERTKHLKGIAWWVNRRMVGEPSWDGLDAEGKYLDGRTSEAKRFSFVVEADILQVDDNQPDWSGFRHNDRVEQVRAAVHKAVIEDLKELFADDRKEINRINNIPRRTL